MQHTIRADDTDTLEVARDHDPAGEKAPRPAGVGQPTVTPPIPFRPVGDDFTGWPMPASVPDGVRVELSRAKLLDGAEARFDDWMQMLHDRYDECVATLGAERMAVEATFVHQEADGSWWMYHLQVCGADSPGLDLSNPVDREHERFARQTKHRGWEELQPRLFLAPPAVRAAVVDAADAGDGAADDPADPAPTSVPAPDERPRRIRRATRVIVVHRARTLLFEDTDPGVPGSAWWTTPGGGLDEGEDWLDAGVRELFEETGVRVPASALQGPIAHRTVVHGYSDRVTEQEEMYYRVRLTDEQVAAGVSTAGHTASERQRIIGHAWVDRHELATLHVWPPQLSELLAVSPDAGVRELGRVEESTVPAGPTPPPVIRHG